MNAKGDANRSVRNTKRRLSEAFLTLLGEKPAREITVRELTELAKVSRGTFYFHYADIYDLLHQIERDQIQNLQVVISDVLENRGNVQPPHMLQELFDYLVKNEVLTKAMFGPYSDPGTLQRLKVALKQQFTEGLEQSGEEALTRNFYVDFVVSGCMGVIETWTQKGCAEPPELMSKLTWQVLNAVSQREA